MPSSAEHDLLFGVTALQLRFVTQEQLVAATSETAAGSSDRPLRDRLCELNYLSTAEADAVAAVVRERLARFGNDPRQTLDSVGAAEAAALATGPATVPFAKADYATRPDDFATRSAKAWTYSAQSQRFTILRLHQQGGLGRLMIARDAELNREIALKEILPAYADSEDNRRRFIREAEITGALEHPGIVPVYSLGEFADGRPYYAMRLVRGIDLRGALQDFHAAVERDPKRPERRIEFRQLLSRFVAVCRAVHYAHTRGVIHRDLKPGNIMLGDHGETLVIDWGLAKTLDGRPSPDDFEVAAVTPSERASSDRTQAGRIVGTTQYMSPEQAEGRVDRLSAASDVYGLGATLYHIVCGRPPLDGSEDDIVLRVQQGRFLPPTAHDPHVPRPLEAICLKAMSRKPSDRYATARDLADDVERYLADERVQAYSEPPTARIWRWMRRHRTAVLSLMAAAIIALSMLTAGVILLGAANLRERQARDEATANFNQAEAERQRAERNFQLAQEAVHDYFVRVSEETLLNQVGMQPLRDTLLRQALAYYERFLAERQEDPQLRRDVALAHYFVGRITETIDSPAKAASHYEQAAKLQKQLLSVYDGNETSSDWTADPALAGEYAQTLNAWGRAMQLSQQAEQARNYFEQAMAVREALAASDPRDADAARALASSKMNLGMLLARGGDAEKGLPLLEQAQSLRLAHADAAQPSPAMQRDLGMGYYNLGAANLSAGNAEAAEKDLRAAIAQFEQLAESTPQDLENIRRLAATRRILADVRAAAGDVETAIDLFEKARESLLELAANNPDVPDYAADLAGVRMNLGAQLDASGDAVGALEEMLAAVDALRSLRDRLTATPRQLRDLGAALRAGSELQLEAKRRDEARKLLEESREVLSELVRDHPTDEDFADQLKQTTDAVAALDSI